MYTSFNDIRISVCAVKELWDNVETTISFSFLWSDEVSYFTEQLQGATNSSAEHVNVTMTDESLDTLLNNGPQSRESFGRWMNSFISDSNTSLEDPSFEAMVTLEQDPLALQAAYHPHSNAPELVFNITEVSPAWAYSSEKTKV